MRLYCGEKYSTLLLKLRFIFVYFFRKVRIGENMTLNTNSIVKCLYIDVFVLKV